MKPFSKLSGAMVSLACLKIVACGLAFFLLVERLRPAGAEPPRQEALVRYVPTSEELNAGYQRLQRSQRQRVPVYKSRIAPHWFDDNTRFWYRNDLPGGCRDFVLVDVERCRR